MTLGNDSLKMNAFRERNDRISRRAFLHIASGLFLTLSIPHAVAAEESGYEAKFQVIWQQPAATYSMTVFYDGKNKLCAEQYNAQGELEIKHFFDLEKEKLVSLYPKVDLETALEQDADTDQFIWRILESQRKRFTSLGKKKIGDWECEGWRETVDRSGKPKEERSALEIWTMSDSGCSVTAKQAGAQMLNLKEYKAKTPAASTFELPAGCKVVT